MLTLSNLTNAMLTRTTRIPAVRALTIIFRAHRTLLRPLLFSLIFSFALTTLTLFILTLTLTTDHFPITLDSHTTYISLTFHDFHIPTDTLTITILLILLVMLLHLTLSF